MSFIDPRSVSRPLAHDARNMKGSDIASPAPMLSHIETVTRQDPDRQVLRLGSLIRASGLSPPRGPKELEWLSRQPLLGVFPKSR